MALFNRKPKSDSVGMPPELQDYYQAENREKSWMAWLLGFVTLVVTILLALALFFGGRWVYRQIRGNDSPTLETTQTQEEASQANEDTDNTAEDEEDTEQQGSTDSTATQDSGSTPTSSETGTSSTSTPSSSVASSATNDLPNTGPADTLAIFVAVSALAYIGHRHLAKN